MRNNTTATTTELDAAREAHAAAVAALTEARAELSRARVRAAELQAQVDAGDPSFDVDEMVRSEATTKGAELREQAAGNAVRGAAQRVTRASAAHMAAQIDSGALADVITREAVGAEITRIGEEAEVQLRTLNARIETSNAVFDALVDEVFTAHPTYAESVRLETLSGSALPAYTAQRRRYGTENVEAIRTNDGNVIRNIPTQSMEYVKRAGELVEARHRQAIIDADNEAARSEREAQAEWDRQQRQHEYAAMFSAPLRQGR